MIRHWLLLFTVLFFVSCNATSSDSTSSSSSGSSGSGGSSGTSGDFTISGQLSSPSVSLPGLSLLEGEGEDVAGLKEATTGTVTDVVAVSPEPGNKTCKIVSVDSNGSFQLPVASGKPWMISFMDRNRSSMFLGMFRFSGFSNFGTLWPNKAGGTLNLGTVSVSGSSGSASSTTSDSSILSSLNLDSTTSEAVRSLGRMGEHYVNPDVDGNGRPDCSESDAKFMLDFHVRFDMKQNSSRVTVSDIIDQYISSTTANASYTGTGIYVAYPNTFSSATTGSVTFVNSAVTTSEGGAIAANTATSAVTNNNFSNYYSFGPNTTSTSELPSGTIIFSFGSKTLTYTNVQTPTLAQITAPTGRIFPFIKFNKTSSACTSNCTVSSISYKWMKRQSDGTWAEASATELPLIISDNGGYLSLRYKSDTDTSKTIGFTLPITSVSASITWDSANAKLSGVTAAQLAAMTTPQLCHVGLSYDDRIGMRYFESVDNVSGTCQ